MIDKINKASLQRHKFLKIQYLKETINRIQKECGNCKMWITLYCPRESNRHRVSYGETKCDKFLITDWATDFTKKREAKIKELIEEIKENK